MAEIGMAMHRTGAKLMLVAAVCMTLIEVEQRSKDRVKRPVRRTFLFEITRDGYSGSPIAVEGDRCG